MSRLSKFRMPRAGVAVLIALAAVFVLEPANAQTATPQQGTQPGQADTQSPFAAPGSEGEGGAGGGMTPARQKAMDDSVLEPRRIAAAVVAADFPSPQMIVQVGAFQGEFLEVFLDKFPTARGQWTEAVTSKANLAATKKRFARFGDRVDFTWGCARRISAQAARFRKTQM